ncbi:1792_t:CDS:2, partial [Gigaspora margarita]
SLFNNYGLVSLPNNLGLVSLPNSCSLVSSLDNNLPEMSGSSKPSSSNGTLVDITSNLNSERHEMLRETAQRNLQQYTDKMMQQILKKRKIVNFKLGDVVKVNIPKIDQFSIDCPTLPCKILEKINDRYQLGCKFGVINICYSSGELEALGTATYTKLSKIPSNQISIRETGRLQSIGMVLGSICNCKGTCDSKNINVKKQI